jgi:hypothetical protein
MVKRLTGAVLLIALFSGCSLFGVFNQAETGLDLSERSEQQLKDAEVIIDSLVIDNMRYKEKLDSCQQSKIGNQRIKSF